MLVGLAAFAVSACGVDTSAPGASPSAEPAEGVSGRELYLRHGCAACHGPEGRGDGPVAPSLEPPPRDLRDPAAYRVGTSVAVIASTLEQGIFVFGGSGMPGYPHIPPAERQELARYIVSLQEEAAPSQEAVP